MQGVLGLGVGKATELGDSVKKAYAQVGLSAKPIYNLISSYEMSHTVCATDAGSRSKRGVSKRT